MSKKEICPICDGKGKIHIISDLSNTQRKTMQKMLIVKKLRTKGKTYRQIMKLTGMSSTSVVDYYLKHGQNKI